MKKGYHVLLLWCYTCQREQPFRHVRRRKSVQPHCIRYQDGRSVLVPSANPTPNVDPDIVLFNAACMCCKKGGRYVTTAARLSSSHYGLADLCVCGLPWGHEGKHFKPELSDVKAKEKARTV